jgi:hypothetical protein
MVGNASYSNSQHCLCATRPWIALPAIKARQAGLTHLEAPLTFFCTRRPSTYFISDKLFSIKSGNKEDRASYILCCFSAMLSVIASLWPLCYSLFGASDIKISRQLIHLTLTNIRPFIGFMISVVKVFIRKWIFQLSSVLHRHGNLTIMPTHKDWSYLRFINFL